jgi:hypothetical protein
MKSLRIAADVDTLAFDLWVVKVGEASAQSTADFELVSGR